MTIRSLPKSLPTELTKAKLYLDDIEEVCGNFPLSTNSHTKPAPFRAFAEKWQEMSRFCSEGRNCR
jgi:hypothetical protein